MIQGMEIGARKVRTGRKTVTEMQVAAGGDEMSIRTDETTVLDSWTELPAGSGVGIVKRTLIPTDQLVLGGIEPTQPFEPRILRKGHFELGRRLSGTKRVDIMAGQVGAIDLGVGGRIHSMM